MKREYEQLDRQQLDGQTARQRYRQKRECDRKISVKETRVEKRLKISNRRLYNRKMYALDIITDIITENINFSAGNTRNKGISNMPTLNSVLG